MVFDVSPSLRQRAREQCVADGDYSFVGDDDSGDCIDDVRGLSTSAISDLLADTRDARLRRGASRGSQWRRRRCDDQDVCYCGAASMLGDYSYPGSWHASAVAVQPAHARCDGGVRLLKTSQQKSCEPPPGLLPASIQDPGGIDGRGVDRRIRAASAAASVRPAAGAAAPTWRPSGGFSGDPVVGVSPTGKFGFRGGFPTPKLVKTPTGKCFCLGDRLIGVLAACAISNACSIVSIFFQSSVGLASCTAR